ncbi:MAG TPA: GH116 family glycosyl hydrolase, partial [bacterium]|nr:GH116 family glycosyl hydrolase [bacterium]
RVLEGPVPDYKIFGNRGTGNGAAGSSYGLPRFQEVAFDARFPFGEVRLQDPDVPLKVVLTGWSPFIPGDDENSCLPVGALEYRFKNTGSSPVEAVYSYNTKNFMATRNDGHTIHSVENGFILWQNGSEENPHEMGSFAAFTDQPDAVVDHCWFRGGWWDPLTMAWKTIQERTLRSTPPVDGPAPGASLFVPFTLDPGEEHTIRVLLAWYVPRTNMRIGQDPDGAPPPQECIDECCENRRYHKPWYSRRFSSIGELIDYWLTHYQTLRTRTLQFSDTFYANTLPPEVTEAVAANLTILKSPTVHRQCDGRLWCWEGCSDSSGCCHGSCTHVWNYAQAMPHLYPALERTLRQTEFHESQDQEGHQVFRSALPVRDIRHTFHAASDGQLGGIMKVHREWRISGDTGWLRHLWPQVIQSLEYCIRTWDPRERGVLEEPHHNTYDIEFWGPDGMCTSFYLGALTAAIRMGNALGDDVSKYETLLDRGKEYMEAELFNGEYFIQQVRWKGLDAPDPVEAARDSWTSDYSQEAMELLEQEGPKYQYGNGCISDGVLGFWIARMCGLGEIIDADKVRSHLRSVHKYNLKHDLTDHANPQRPAFAVGNDGGLLLCTWPHGGQPALPFVYSNEVWTGIEYQVASHCILEGLVEEGLEIIRTARQRYDGSRRNPFDEYECGHWYARALSSYGLLQALTGVRYDAVNRTLYFDSRMGENFRSLLAAETGYGMVGLQNGKPFVKMVEGDLDVQSVLVSGREMKL